MLNTHLNKWTTHIFNIQQQTTTNLFKYFNLDESPLSMMDRSLNFTVAGTKSTTISKPKLVEIFGGEDAEEIVAELQMERHDTWYVTFQTSKIVDYLMVKP